MKPKLDKITFTRKEDIKEELEEVERIRKGIIKEVKTLCNSISPELDEGLIFISDYTLKFRSYYIFASGLDELKSPNKLMEARKSISFLNQILEEDYKALDSIKFTYKNTRKKSIIIDSEFIIRHILKAIKENKDFIEFRKGYEEFLHSENVKLTGRPKKEIVKSMKKFSLDMNAMLKPIKFKSENQRFALIANLINIVRNEFKHPNIEIPQIRTWLKSTKIK